MIVAEHVVFERAGPQAVDGIPVLVELLDNKYEAVVSHAVVAFGEIGPDAASAAPQLRAFVTRNPQFRMLANKSFAKMKVAEMKEEDLGEKAYKPEKCNEYLTKHPHSYNAYRVFQDIQFGKILPEEVLPQLVECAKQLNYDGEWMKRCQVAEIFASMHEQAAPAVPVLITWLNDKNWLVRSDAAKALGAVGKAAQSALPALQEAVNKDSDARVRESADAAMAAIRGVPYSYRSFNAPQRPRPETVLSHSSGAGVDFGPYMADVQRRMRELWLPAHANDPAKVAVSFQVDASGKTSNVRIQQSSGKADVDAAALQAVQQASPLRPLLTGSPVTIQFTFDRFCNGSGMARLLP